MYVLVVHSHISRQKVKLGNSFSVLGCLLTPLLGPSTFCPRSTAFHSLHYLATILNPDFRPLDLCLVSSNNVELHITVDFTSCLPYILFSLDFVEFCVV